MLLIFGFRTRLRTVLEGVFHCPRCQQDRPFARKQARRWFTLFFLPVIPLKVAGEFIECQTCQGRFTEAVLDAPTTPVLAESMDKALEVIGATLRDEYSADHTVITGWVAPLAESMSMQGKEHMVSAATAQALDQGAMTTDRQAVVDTVGHALGLTDAHIRGIVSTVEASHPAPPA